MEKPTRHSKQFWRKLLNILLVSCMRCGGSLSGLSGEGLSMKWGVISNAHGAVYGWQFRLKCFYCGKLLRFDEDEIEIDARVDAVSAEAHS